MRVQRLKKFHQLFNLNQLLKFLFIIPTVKVFIVSMKRTKHSAHTFTPGKLYITNFRSTNLHRLRDTLRIRHQLLFFYFEFFFTLRIKTFCLYFLIINTKNYHCNVFIILPIYIKFSQYFQKYYQTVLQNL